MCKTHSSIMGEEMKLWILHRMCNNLKREMFTTILILFSLASVDALQQTHGIGGGDYGAHKRTEWPELLHKNLSAILEHLLEPMGAYDPNFSIFTQKPLPREQKRPEYEEDTDLWLYLTGDDVIYEIPRHGRWHPNRISPGWPELLGVHYKDAMRIIMDEMPGVLVDYGPMKRPKPKGTQINRVVFYIDNDEKIARIPNVG